MHLSEKWGFNKPYQGKPMGFQRLVDQPWLFDRFWDLMRTRCVVFLTRRRCGRFTPEKRVLGWRFHGFWAGLECFSYIFFQLNRKKVFNLLVSIHVVVGWICTSRISNSWAWEYVFFAWIDLYTWGFEILSFYRWLSVFFTILARTFCWGITADNRFCSVF